MPCPCQAGNTEIGPRPNQPVLPSLIVTGDTATWPITFPSISATSETLSSPRARRASTMNCSVRLLCAAFRNAASVSAWRVA